MCERRELFCFWEQERSISQQTHKPRFNDFAYFWGQQPVISDVCDGEMSVGIHCIFSEIFHSVPSFNIHFAVTKPRKSA